MKVLTALRDWRLQRRARKARLAIQQPNWPAKIAPKVLKWLGQAVIIIFIFAGAVRAEEVINVQRLASAIYRAEHSKSHPYGIMIKCKNPRQVCINTINHRLKLWNGKGDFISYLQKTYAPLNVANDPKNLNVNWNRNVKFYYAKLR